MTTHSTEVDLKPVHRSFRLTRPSAPRAAAQVAPALVLPERDIRTVATVAGRHDVSDGGCWSVGPSGVQLWSGPWDGALGGRGSAEHLGSVDWSYDTPVMQYVTVYRVLVTTAGTSAGETTASILDRVLGLAGLQSRGDAGGRAAVVPPPRDPFRSSILRTRL